MHTHTQITIAKGPKYQQRTANLEKHRHTHTHTRTYNIQETVKGHNVSETGSVSLFNWKYVTRRRRKSRSLFTAEQVSQSAVCLGTEPRLGLMTRCLLYGICWASSLTGRRICLFLFSWSWNFYYYYYFTVA